MPYQEDWQIEENPNAARVRVTIRLQGDELNPVEVTGVIAVDPTFAAAKGALRQSGRGGAAPLVEQVTGVWTYATSALTTTSLERHLVAALEIIEPHAAELKRLVEARDLTFDLVCYWVSATGQGGPGITPKTLSRIGAAGAILAFEIQGPFDDE